MPFLSHLSFCSEGGEWSDSSKFALCTIICHSTFPLGLMMMSGIAYLIRDWRILQLVLFSPLVLVLGIFYWSEASRFTFKTCFLKTIKVYILVCDLGSIRPLGFFQSQLAGSSPRARRRRPSRKSAGQRG